MMRLFVLKRLESPKHDEATAFVVRAESRQKAR